MKMKRIAILPTILVMGIGLSAQAQASLVVRGTDTAGNQLIYDTDRNITWYDATVIAPWPTAMGWAANLVVTYEAAPISDWRLPNAYNADGSGPCLSGNPITVECTGSEIGHLFFTELGNHAYPPNAIPNTGFPDGLTGQTETFQHLYASQYWFGTLGTPVGSHVQQAWNFSTKLGGQGQAIAFYDGAPYGTGLYAMAVRDGDVAAVPVPAAIWLLGSGLAGLAGTRLRRKK